jgi:hypothetical protein
MCAEAQGFISWIGFITNQKEISPWHKAEFNPYIRSVIRTRHKHNNLILGFCPQYGLKIEINVQNLSTESAFILTKIE